MNATETKVVELARKVGLPQHGLKMALRLVRDPLHRSQQSDVKAAASVLYAFRSTVPGACLQAFEIVNAIEGVPQNSADPRTYASRVNRVLERQVLRAFRKLVAAKGQTETMSLEACASKLFGKLRTSADEEAEVSELIEKVPTSVLSGRKRSSVAAALIYYVGRGRILQSRICEAAGNLTEPTLRNCLHAIHEAGLIHYEPNAYNDHGFQT